MNARGVGSLVLTGDNLYDEGGSYESVWLPWFYDGFDFSIVALGNHTLGYEEEINFFGSPGEFYSKVIGKSQFIVLNSDNTLNVNAQMSFLEKALKQRRSTFVFIVLHHPFVTVSDRHSWKEREAFQKQFRKIILRNLNRVTAVIAGHDHIAALTNVNGLPLIVSGASWEIFPAKYYNYQDEDFYIRTLWNFGNNSNPYWVRLEINDSDVWTHFIDARLNKTQCSARLVPRPILLRDCRSFSLLNSR